MRSIWQTIKGATGSIGSILLLLVACPRVLFAAQSLTIASVYSDLAVIQRGRPVVVWGRGSPGARIDVNLGGRTASTVVHRSGGWRLSVAALPAREDFELSVKSATGEAIVLHHLAAGDVWLCAGQSNMEFPLRSASNAGTELAQSRDDLLRFCWSRASARTPRR